MPPSLRRLVLLTAMAMAAGSCADGGAPSGEGGDGGSPARFSREVAVELLDAGSEPRERLRVQPPPGATAVSRMSLRIALQSSLDGQPQPAPDPVSFATDVVTEVTDTGDDVTAAVSYEGAGPADPAVDLATAKQLASLNGLGGTLVLSPQGTLVSAEFEPAVDLEAPVVRLVEELAGQLANLAVTFPAEPVGAGARWVARYPFETSGLDTEVEVTYTLRERDGPAYSVETAYRQTAPAQDADFAGLPSGADVRLLAYQVEGTGTASGTVAELLPRNSSITTSGELVLEVTGEGVTSELRQRPDTSVELARAP